MLKVYGTPVVKYKGKCNFISGSGVVIKGRFECIQLQDGDIYLLAVISKREHLRIWPKVQDFSLRNSYSLIKKIEGVLLDGRLFETEGTLILTRIEDFLPLVKTPTRIVYHLGSITIKASKTSTKRSRVRFHLTNLVFIGAEWHWEVKNRIGFTKTSFSIRRKIFTIYPRPDYKIRIEEMKATRICNVTSYVETNPGSKRIETVQSQIEVICNLLSVAKGTKINWIFYEVFNNKGKLTEVVHVNRITRDYTSLWLIGEDEPKLLREFVNKTFPVYEQLSENYPMAKFINTLLVAKLDGSFIELRALIFATMVDVLCGVWARLNNRVYVMDETKFLEKLDDFTANLSDFIKHDLNVNIGMSNSMASHARGLNYFTFGSTLRKVLKSFNVDLSQHDVQNFVRSRNQLVHAGEFSTEDKTREFFEIMRFADRLVLGMLAFEVGKNDPHRRFLR